MQCKVAQWLRPCSTCCIVGRIQTESEELFWSGRSENNKSTSVSQSWRYWTWSPTQEAKYLGGFGWMFDAEATWTGLTDVFAAPSPFKLDFFPPITSIVIKKKLQTLVQTYTHIQEFCVLLFGSSWRLLWLKNSPVNGTVQTRRECSDRCNEISTETPQGFFALEKNIWYEEQKYQLVFFCFVFFGNKVAARLP